MAIVTMKNMSKRYFNGADDIDGLLAVSDFNLEVKDGEVVVFVGPSGCGKTTTLRMIAGLEEISEGELYIDGKLMNDVHPKDRDLAMVFQNYALFPHMTVFENIAFGLKPNDDMPEDEIKAKVEKAAEILKIAHLLERKPRELSGGQKQRTALGRAIVRDHKIILLDEPLSNLDSKMRIYMRTELIKLQQRVGTSFIYVTHSQSEATAIADRLVIMKDGVIQQVDTPENVYSRPANLFVAGFMCTPKMNMWYTNIIENDGDIFINFGDKKIKLPDSKVENSRAKEYIGKEVIAGLRAEDIYADSENIKRFSGSVIDAEVKVAEHMGSEIIVHFAYVNAMNVDGELPTARISSKRMVKTKDIIKLALDTDRIYLFDKDTETVIAY